MTIVSNFLGGRIAQERLKLADDGTHVGQFAKTIFQCPFFLQPDGSTVDFDQSPIAATETFNGGAIISAAAPDPPILGVQNALRLQAPADYVEMPAHLLYDIRQSDFTIEFLRNFTTAPAWPIQWCGVWDHSDPTKQLWRFFSDANNDVFEMNCDGAHHVFSIPHFLNLGAGLGTGNTWYYQCVQRKRTSLQMSSLSNVSALGSGFLLTRQLVPATDDPVAVPLRIGGPVFPDVAVGSGTFYLLQWRIVRDFVYGGDGVNFAGNGIWNVALGQIRPTIVPPSDDVFYPPVVAKNMYSPPPASLNDDVIYLPTVKWNRTLTPARVVDTDNFYTRANFTGPGLPAVTGGAHALFKDITVSNGNGATATLTLPSTRDPRDLLVALVATKKRLLVIDLPGHDEDSDTSFDGFQGNGFGEWYLDDWKVECGSMTWAFQYVKDIGDISSAPMFTWTGASDWIGAILRFSEADLWFPFNGGYFMSCGSGRDVISLGAGSNLDRLFSGNFETALYVQVITIDNDQIIPLPAGYTLLHRFNLAAGSMLVCYQPAPRNDNLGSDWVQITLGADANWTVFSFTVSGLVV